MEALKRKQEKEQTREVQITPLISFDKPANFKEQLLRPKYAEEQEKAVVLKELKKEQ
jgi:hypothetical protein